MKNNTIIKISKKLVLFFFFLITNITVAQNDHLIIGRTTGSIALKKNLDIRVFGFSKSLSGAIFLPGPSIDAVVKDTVTIDFWNISQGNPASIVCDDVVLKQYNKDQELLSTKQPIDHMEHGFYEFVAEKPGIYLYYSPENYPFNLQAGMFGTIIIRDKMNAVAPKKTNNELLWCSNELDEKWHTDDIMTVAHNNINKELELPPYAPHYFLINGQQVKKIKGLQPLQNKENEHKLTIRLVNAGLYQHEIDFPLAMKLEMVFGKNTQVTKSSKSFKVTLHKGECIALLATMKNVSKKAKITYTYRDPATNIIKHKTGIPVFFKN